MVLVCGQFLARVKEILENTSKKIHLYINKKLAFASFLSFHFFICILLYVQTFPSNLTMNDHVLGICENTLLIYGI